MVKIQEFMERTGIRNQTALADKLGLTQSAISAWNAGTRAPTYETCIDLLKIGMTISELFGDDVGAIASNNSMVDDDGFDLRVKKSLLRILGG